MQAAYRKVLLARTAASIEERVNEEAEWWEPEPVFKMNYRVALEDDRELEILGITRQGVGTCLKAPRSGGDVLELTEKGRRSNDRRRPSAPFHSPASWCAPQSVAPR